MLLRVAGARWGLFQLAMGSFLAGHPQRGDKAGGLQGKEGEMGLGRGWSDVMAIPLTFISPFEKMKQ